MSSIRELIKLLVPEELRLLRYRLFEKLKYYPDILLRLGHGLECPFCGWRFRRFKAAGFHYPVITENQVIGGHWHEDNVCPRCLSNARERLAYLFLQNRTDIFNKPLRILHIAPEPMLAAVFKRSPKLQHVTSDLFEPNVNITSDILSLPFGDQTFDVIICNHVLEHVPDDRRAMGELYRALKSGGWALVQVPIALALDRTLEDPSAATDEDRIRLFGQADHVRLYSRNDYFDRLVATGFKVQAHPYGAELGVEAVRRHGLVAEEEIFIAERPRAS